ncbi:MAG: hypothetical protein ABI416_09795 [Ginsengibacter sp.]
MIKARTGKRGFLFFFSGCDFLPEFSGRKFFVNDLIDGTHMEGLMVAVRLAGAWSGMENPWLFLLSNTINPVLIPWLM